MFIIKKLEIVASQAEKIADRDIYFKYKREDLFF